ANFSRGERGTASTEDQRRPEQGVRTSESGQRRLRSPRPAELEHRQPPGEALTHPGRSRREADRAHKAPGTAGRGAEAAGAAAGARGTWGARSFPAAGEPVRI